MVPLRRYTHADTQTHEYIHKYITQCETPDTSE